MSQSRTKQLALKALESMDASAQELRDVIQDLGGATKLETRARLANSLESTTVRLAECYQTVHRLHASITGAETVADPCRVLKCSRLESLESAIQEGIDTIERTRTSFKSRELGTLRRRLKDVLGQSK